MRKLAFVFQVSVADLCCLFGDIYISCPRRRFTTTALSSSHCQAIGSAGAHDALAAFYQVRQGCPTEFAGDGGKWTGSTFFEVKTLTGKTQVWSWGEMRLG